MKSKSINVDSIPSVYRKTNIRYLVGLVLKYVSNGQQIKAEELLKQNSFILLKKGNITDYAKRSFSKISPLQYAAWSYDISMLRMFLKYIPEEAKITAYQQLVELDNVGTKYGSHYDFSNLINSLQNCLDPINYFNYWQTTPYRFLQVGRAQKNAPVHIMNEYCHPRRFFKPTPIWSDTDLIRSTDVYDFPDLIFKTSWVSLDLDFQQGTKLEWASLDTGLGNSFAIIRGDLKYAIKYVCPSTSQIRHDCIQLYELKRLRTIEYAGFKQQLSGELSETPLLNLPTEITGYLIPAAADHDFKYTSIEATRAMCALSNTCKTFYTFFKPELTKRKSETILSYVLKCNDQKVLKLAATCPETFFVKSTVIDNATDLDGNHRILKDWSPYQALIGTGNVDLLKKVKPYLDVYLRSQFHGFDMAREQQIEKFPDGLDYPDELYDLESLAKAITADRKPGEKSPNRFTFAELIKFWEYCKPEVVEIGHHFNMKLFNEAHSIYDRYSSSWNKSQRNFFSVFVIGFLERLLPTPYLKKLRLGLIKTDLLRHSEDCEILLRGLGSLGKNQFIDYYTGSNGTLSKFHSVTVGRTYSLEKMVNDTLSDLNKLMYKNKFLVPSCTIA